MGVNNLNKALKLLAADPPGIYHIVPACNKCAQRISEEPFVVKVCKGEDGQGGRQDVQNKSLSKSEDPDGNHESGVDYRDDQ